MRWRVWSYEATNPRLHQPIRRRWWKGGAAAKLVLGSFVLRLVRSGPSPKTENQAPRTRNSVN